VESKGSATLTSASGPFDFLANATTAQVSQNWTGNIPVTWTQQTSSGSRNWLSLAMTTTGSSIIAGTYVNHIFSSTTRGASWTTLGDYGSGYWNKVAVSANGTYILATNYGGGYSWLSTDSGASFNYIGDCGVNSWSGCAMSADASHMILVATDGTMYYSTNSGASWHQQTTTNPGWGDIACNADFSKLVAVAYGGYVYTSSNGGVSWSQKTSSDSKNWSAVCISSDGSKIFAHTDSTDYIYYSGDGGTTWSALANSGSRIWKDIACSDTGQIIIAAEYSGYIYVSTDGGASSWDQQTGPGSQSWRSVAITGNGSFMTAAPYGGYIYTYGQSTESFTVGSTTITNSDIAVGSSLATTLASIVTAFNAKAGNCSCYLSSSSKIVYYANAAGVGGNSYVATETSDAASVYSFSATTLSGGTETTGGNLTSSNAALILGTAYTPSSGWNDVGDVGIGGDFSVNGLMKYNSGTVNKTITITNTNSPYTIQVTDYAIFADTSAGPITIIWPTALITVGRTYVIFDSGFNSATNNITFQTQGSQKIDNSVSDFIINNNGDSISAISNGTDIFLY
jgi:hypothetical protein